MRTFILTISALFILTLSYGQSSTESKAILDKANQLFEQSEGVKLTFILNTEESDGTTYEPQSGTALVKGDKFQLDIPYATTWFDGKTQWVLLKDANEVNISNPTPQEIASISPLALLNMYKTDYTLKQPINKTINNKAVVQIEMTPNNKTQEFKNITITIDKKTNGVVQINFTTNNGIKNSLTLSEYNTNYRFSNDIFTFDKSKHPDVEIIDLR
ncbi:MAG: LolA-like putative outer membrane lipoprotein chaperone [Dysgonamonadaceae bacterium]|nr:LolA-like putative outer membrane lipoprotein chaperone [Dysgonamonadaceae bacterium]MDD4728434.1 LolA-like putative outer membrane lipoprotein chaperone [Dysgonamonadaceae bacterium]